MLTDEEALAVLLGLIAGRRAGLVTTSVAAAESAAAKLHRALPEALGRRLDTLLQTAEFTLRPRPVAAPETGVLLLLAEAARDRRPVAIGYTASDGRRTERTVHPYGIVAHSGRWYVTGADSASGQTRTFRLDRISGPEMLAGTFGVPAGFDPAERVLSGLAQTPYRHEVSLRVQGRPGRSEPGSQRESPPCTTAPPMTGGFACGCEPSGWTGCPACSPA
jgi:predicted DNA-binding transcriptional regulator YafY